MTPDNLDAIYALASLQQGLLFHSISHPRSGAYIEQIQCVLGGEVDLPVFRQTWQMLMQRHEPLRTSFHWEGLSTPVQSVWKTLPLPWRELDWRGRSDAEIATDYERLLADDRKQGFNLAQPPLMRFRLIQVRDDAYRFVWTHHHLLLDGWSVHRLLRELLHIYEQSKAGRAIDLPPVTPYREYIRWLQQQPRTDAETYWRNHLRGIQVPTPVPGARVSQDTAAEMEDVYAETRRLIDERLSAKVQQFVQHHRITVNTMVLGAWALLQRRYVESDDVLLGVTVAGRPAALHGADRMVGLFINTLPARITVPLRAPVGRWLRELQLAQAEARQYDTTPLVDVQGWSDVPRGTPLFDTVFVCENYPDRTEVTRAGGLQIEQATSYEPTHFALTMTVNSGRHIALQLGYARRRFDVARIERLLDQYTRLLAGMVADAARPLGRIPLIADEEQRAWVVDWNRTARAIDEASVASLIAAQAVARPDAIAAECSDASLTYAALEGQAADLAQRLRAMGVERETVVAVCLEPSPELIVALLAVMKAGAAYLPLDPSDPPARLAFLLEDSHAAVLITHQACADRVPTVWIPMLDLDEEAVQTVAETVPSPDAWPPRSGDLAYVIYTSGSTGTPKGVLVTHGGLRNYVAWAAAQYGVEPGMRTLLHTSVSFDLAVTSFWVPLVAGGTVVIGRGPAGAALLDALRQQRFGLVKLTPMHLALVEQSDVPHAAAVAVVGGEALSVPAAQAWLRRAGPGARLYNEYGPTETTVGSSVSDAVNWTATGSAPIGRPIANTQMYVLDEALMPVPVGVPGALYIGGAGLARGYLGAPALTASRFVPDPFGGGGGRLYRTGDRACYRADGELEYLGRADGQVKVRGYRIEPDEVEAVLQMHPLVAQAVVVPRASAGGVQIAAYVVPRTGAAQDTAAVRAHVASRLPDYLVPSAWAWLDALPLTAHGKVDRARLPPIVTAAPQAWAAPRAGIEQQVAAIWADVLQVERVGLNDSFFDLGGHSLTLVTALSQMRSKLRLDLSITDLFQYPTIAALTQFIQSGSTLAATVADAEKRIAQRASASYNAV